MREKCPGPRFVDVYIDIAPRIIERRDGSAAATCKVPHHLSRSDPVEKRGDGSAAAATYKAFRHLSRSEPVEKRGDGSSAAATCKVRRDLSRS